MPKETPFTLILSKLGDLLVLNLLCLFCAVPLVTAGASFSALYAVLFRQQREESVSLVRDFFRAFRRNFWQATALEAIIALVILFGVTDLQFALAASGTMGTVYLIAGAAVLVIGFILQTLAIPQQAVYHNTVRNYLVNSLALAVCDPGRLLLSVAAWVIPWLLLVMIPDFFLQKLGAVYLMWGLSAPAWVTVKLLGGLFRKAETK